MMARRRPRTMAMVMLEVVSGSGAKPPRPPTSPPPRPSRPSGASGARPKGFYSDARPRQTRRSTGQHRSMPRPQRPCHARDKCVCWNVVARSLCSVLVCVSAVRRPPPTHTWPSSVLCTSAQARRHLADSESAFSEMQHRHRNKPYQEGWTREVEIFSANLRRNTEELVKRTREAILAEHQATQVDARPRYSRHARDKCISWNVGCSACGPGRRPRPPRMPGELPSLQSGRGQGQEWPENHCSVLERVSTVCRPPPTIL